MNELEPVSDGSLQRRSETPSRQLGICASIHFGGDALNMRFLRTGTVAKNLSMTVGGVH